jgi:hypothetical protein
MKKAKGLVLDKSISKDPFLYWKDQNKPIYMSQNP